ncbi:RNA polymerase sigma factor [Streptomyces albidus (ex Kaewkla and Franco 2022)]|uniref:RNA polymerase sigma factor n=1 Tax=Streptomyces albidus (ex Kaewkla and Franco 2022) TaxID=722709 RepID=UPI0015EE93A8|nr:sigma-70 family RNA polymerase sigma factor [Streptomyces albidus (ex Kaewkla and Franco 2022)]
MEDAANIDLASRQLVEEPLALPGRELAEELHEREFAGLVRHLLFQGASWTEAQDAAQDAFTQMCRPGVRISHPKAWLRTVAWRSWVGQQVRVEDAYPEIPDCEAVIHWQCPAQAVEIGHEEREVIAVLLSLPAKQRAAMAWLCDGFTTEEIAREMKTTQASVRQNVARARAALKAGLGLQQPANEERPDD